jgi:hypothetical protein
MGSLDVSFRFKFKNDANNITLPLSSLAENVNGTCTLWVQYLDDEEHNMSNDMIFGSMIL